MVDREGARTIVGIIGNVISFGLFLSPIPKFIKIWKQKAVEEFKPDPYLATVLNCMMWTFYGMPFVQPDSILVITINGIGLATEAVYVFIFFLYSPWQKRRNIMFALVVELVFMAVVIFITLYFFHNHKNRAMIVGILCTVYNVIMHTSSLAIACRVIKTRSVKYLPFPLSLADFCNGICWAIYALLKLDPYILIINGLGTLSGLAQLILYACYYKSTNWDDDDGKPEVQISNWDDDDGKPEVQNSNDKIVVELLISHILC